MTEPKSSGTILLETSLFDWWFSFIISNGAVAFTIVCPFVLVAKGMVHPLIIIIFFIVFMYGLMSYTRRIVIDDTLVRVVLPWRTWRIPADEITSINIKIPYMKAAFITIVRKKVFFNLPIRLYWEFKSSKSEDYEKVLEDVVKRFGGKIRMRGLTKTFEREEAVEGKGDVHKIINDSY